MAKEAKEARKTTKRKFLIQVLSDDPPDTWVDVPTETPIRNTADGLKVLKGVKKDGTYRVISVRETRVVKITTATTVTLTDPKEEEDKPDDAE